VPQIGAGGGMLHETLVAARARGIWGRRGLSLLRSSMGSRGAMQGRRRP
jgi:hypothetical protein